MWQGPHAPLPVEETWNGIIRSIGGTVVAENISRSPSFENADYFFPGDLVVAELKELDTEFSDSKRFRDGYDDLHRRIVQDDPNWRPLLLGGDGKYPDWFYAEFPRLLRPPISRVLKKANRQIRETKLHFRAPDSHGVLLLVNDKFTSFGPMHVAGLASELLAHSYSSIDCFVYLTVNTYVEVPRSELANLIWVPSYSERASDTLVAFVNELGRKWADHLEKLIGPFSDRTVTEHADSLRGSRVIRGPPYVYD